jgi:hypothetical protein
MKLCWVELGLEGVNKRERMLVLTGVGGWVVSEDI